MLIWTTTNGKGASPKSVPLERVCRTGEVYPEDIFLGEFEEGIGPTTQSVLLIKSSSQFQTTFLNNLVVLGRW